jgi:hypothetical protein
MSFARLCFGVAILSYFALPATTQNRSWPELALKNEQDIQALERDIRALRDRLDKQDADLHDPKGLVASQRQQKKTIDRQNADLKTLDTLLNTVKTDFENSLQDLHGGVAANKANIAANKADFDSWRVTDEQKTLQHENQLEGLRKQLALQEGTHRDLDGFAKDAYNKFAEQGKAMESRMTKYDGLLGGSGDLGGAKISAFAGGHRVAVLGSSNAGDGYATVNNKEGHQRAHMYVKEDGSGGVETFTANGTPIAALGSEDSGGALRLMPQGIEDTSVHLYIDKQGNGKLDLKGAGQDVAETFLGDPNKTFAPGMVVSIGPDGATLQPSSIPYDQSVVGIIAGAGALSSAIRLDRGTLGANTQSVAVVGQVYVKVCLEAGPIKPGDLLVSSSLEGVAMRASNRDKAFGAVVAKALQAFNPEDAIRETQGLIRAVAVLR